MKSLASRSRWGLLSGPLFTLLLCCAACLGTNPLKGKLAPALMLPATDGTAIDLAKHKGKDVVVLDFWATWCPPCRKALPGIAALARKYEGKPVAVYPINVGESREQVVSFLEQQGIGLRVGLDESSETAGNFGVDALPTTMVVDQNGVIVEVFTGYGPGLEEEIEAVIRRLLTPAS